MNDEPHNLPLSSGTRPRLAAKARVQTDKISGKLALLYPEGVLLLNPTGATIVELCDGQHTVAGVVTELATRYNLTADRLSGDVTEYLGRLRERGLLELMQEQENSR